MAELLASAILPVLFEKMTSAELVQFLRQEGLYSKIKKWEETLEMIRSLLAHAEKRTKVDFADNWWLYKLEDLAYDVEDMLDEFDYEAKARKIKMDQRGDSKFWKLVPASFCNWSLEAIRFRSRMRSQVKNVTTRFDELCQLRHRLALRDITGEASSSAATERPPTSCLRTEPAIYGRDEDKKKIVDMVLKNEPTDANFLVIPIVGMGGVGKTTLAREVYHTVVEHFEVKAWVCVSDGHLDLTRVSMLILEDITGSVHDHKNLNTVQNKLKQEINGKKFLLVLDDVWSINCVDWETLRSPFMESALGSRVIVTTRDEKVALTFTHKGFHSLRVLSVGDCLSMFFMCMLEKEEAILAHPSFDLICKAIERCKGLPLAVKTLAGILRSKQIDEWLTILNSMHWNMWSENDENEIPVALKLSYHYLPSHLKRCFTFCAIFPKGYKFDKEELILLWIGEGLVQQSTANNKWEDLGRQYFDELVSWSLFQQSSSNSYNFFMHDFVHDLAYWAFGALGLRLDDVWTVEEQESALLKARHLSFSSNQYDVEKNFAIFQKAEYLKTRIRTFLPIFRRHDFRRFICNSVLADLLPKLIRLRVLSLQSYCISELSSSIGGLKHLRYLNLSETDINSLPESTCLFYNLQILMLRYCSRLKKLPSNFKYLIKLHHLDIEGATLIKEMPLGMKELINLQKLSNFIVGNGVGSSLKDLMSLRKLRGELCISGLDNVISFNHEDLILCDKNIKELSLKWGSQFHKSRNQTVEEIVLDALQPHQNLEKLTVECYGGTKFSSWLGDASYSKITTIRLQNCEKCMSLPSLGELANLRELTIEGMKGLTHIGFEFYGKGHSQSFKSLKTLHFKDLPEWVSWEATEENAYGAAFICLHGLLIENCPKLSGILLDHTSLEKLVIQNCKQLVISLLKVPRLRELDIDGCKTITCKNLMYFMLMKSMSLHNISEFSNHLMQECFGEAKFQQIKGGLQSIHFLTELSIGFCLNIVSFPEVCFLPYLSKLEIIYCNALTSLPDRMKHKNACLESLKISWCDSLAFIVRGQLPPSLKRLEISGCEKLGTLWDDREQSGSSMRGKGNDNNTNSCLLEYLSVSHCKSLTCLSPINQVPATLKYLSFNSCQQLTTIAEGFDNNTSLQSISIECCENLQIPKGLRSLRHLRVINIDECKSIEWFPEQGLADTNLRELQIINCEKLKALPNGLRILNTLHHLAISKCPRITSFNPEEDFPANLRSLDISECVNVYRPLVEWGFHKLTSLKSLGISGCPDVECFPQQEMEMMLPRSLTQLAIRSLPKLKHLWSQGFQYATSLQSLTIRDCPDLTSLADQGLPSSLNSLEIFDCPKLTCFPKQGLPSSLRTLYITNCTKLKKKCKRNKGREWSKISNILEVKIDSKYIHELEEVEQPPSRYSFANCHPMHCYK